MRWPSRQTTARLIARRAPRPAATDARQIGEHEPFGAVGDAGEMERPASAQGARPATRG